MAGFFVHRADPFATIPKTSPDMTLDSSRETKGLVKMDMVKQVHVDNIMYGHCV